MPKCVRFALIIGCMVCSAGCQFRPDVSPGLEPQDEDFAQVRSSFKTKLIRQGPSPQTGEPLQTPSAANEIEYRSGDLVFKAFVTPDPGDGQKRPAVLFLHGGFAFGGDDWDMAQPYRDAGYIVMAPILRGENGQPGLYTMFYDEVDDVLGACASLASLPYVDSKRIFVSGHSGRDARLAGRDGLGSVPGGGFPFRLTRPESHRLVPAQAGLIRSIGCAGVPASLSGRICEELQVSGADVLREPGKLGTASDATNRHIGEGEGARC